MVRSGSPPGLIKFDFKCPKPLYEDAMCSAALNLQINKHGEELALIKELKASNINCMDQVANSKGRFILNTWVEV